MTSKITINHHYRLIIHLICGRSIAQVVSYICLFQLLSCCFKTILHNCYWIKQHQSWRLGLQPTRFLTCKNLIWPVGSSWLGHELSLDLRGKQRAVWLDFKNQSCKLCKCSDWVLIIVHDEKTACNSSLVVWLYRKTYGMNQMHHAGEHSKYDACSE